MIHVLVVLAFYSNVCGARRILYLQKGGGGGALKRSLGRGVKLLKQGG